MCNFCDLDLDALLIHCRLRIQGCLSILPR